MIRARKSDFLFRSGNPANANTSSLRALLPGRILVHGGLQNATASAVDSELRVTGPGRHGDGQALGWQAPTGGSCGGSLLGALHQAQSNPGRVPQARPVQ